MLINKKIKLYNNRNKQKINKMLIKIKQLKNKYC